MEENMKIYIYIIAVHLKLTQHCKSTIVQLKKKECHLETKTWELGMLIATKMSLPLSFLGG